MKREDVYIILLFMFILCAGLLVGHMLTDKYCMNFEKKIDAVIQSYEAK